MLNDLKYTNRAFQIIICKPRSQKERKGEEQGEDVGEGEGEGREGGMLETFY